MSDTENKKGTEYSVYAAKSSLDFAANDLVFCGNAMATSDTSAIAQVGVLNDGSLFVAIPTRFLRIRTVKIDPNPKVVIT